MSTGGRQLRPRPSSLGMLAAVVLLVGLAPVRSAGAIELAGVREPVEIVIDDLGIPHIIAENDLDAAFAQGYVDAKDRFFQMDLVRRQVSGTLAELFGEALLETDIQFRTLGLRRAAHASFQAFGPELKAWVRAYADGVNAWLENNDLPPEYQFIEITEARPWTPVDTIVVGKALAFQLSFDLDIGRSVTLGTYQQVGEQAGFDGTALFFQDTHRAQPIAPDISVPGFLSSIGGVGKTAVEKTALADYANLTPEGLDLAADYHSKVKDMSLLGKTLKPQAERGGSNWWVVDGEHSESGEAMLANDPHLSLDTPPVFTEVHIISNDPAFDHPMQATGVSVPGAPGVIQGCNQRICWGSTVSPTDVTDTYEEQVVTNVFGLPTATVHDGKQEPVRWIFQEYKVNVLGDGERDNLERANVGYDEGAITFLVPRRNNGPILDLSGNTALSVQYTGWGPTRELLTFKRWNRARNLDQFREALKYFDIGAQNFGYADVDGNIAYFTSAEVPIREDLQTLERPDGGVPPFFIRDGSGELAHDWLPVQNPQPAQATPSEIMPFEEMPKAINPDRGWIANTNNDPIGLVRDNNPLNQLRPGGGIYYMNPGFDGLRIGRISDILESLTADGGKVSRDEMIAAQADSVMFDAQRLTDDIVQAFDNATADGAWPPLTELAASTNIAEAVARIEDWDHSTPTGIELGYDPFDDPSSLPAPEQAEIDASVAATLFSLWRSRMIANTVDATLERVGLGDQLPGSRGAVNAVHHLLARFDSHQGIGASGLDFMAVEGAPTRAAARDTVILRSLRDALDLLASDAFAPAYENSTALEDYRWGKLHRIVLLHPFGPGFSLPQPAFGFTPISDELPGIPRSGGYNVLDRSDPNPRGDAPNDFMFDAGPSRRFVGVLDAAGIDALEVIPGGQSGVISSPHFGDQLPLWATNDYHPLIFDQAAAEAAEAERISLTPGG